MKIKKYDFIIEIIYSYSMEKISDDVTKGAGKSAARAMLRAVGLKDDDFNKFQVGVVSAGNEVTPCNLTGPELSEYDQKRGLMGQILLH